MSRAGIALRDALLRRYPIEEPALTWKVGQEALQVRSVLPNEEQAVELIRELADVAIAGFTVADLREWKEHAIAMLHAGTIPPAHAVVLDARGAPTCRCGWWPTDRLMATADDIRDAIQRRHIDGQEGRL